MPFVALAKKGLWAVSRGLLELRMARLQELRRTKTVRSKPFRLRVHFAGAGGDDGPLGCDDEQLLLTTTGQAGTLIWGTAAAAYFGSTQMLRKKTGLPWAWR